MNEFIKQELQGALESSPLADEIIYKTQDVEVTLKAFIKENDDDFGDWEKVVTIAERDIDKEAAIILNSKEYSILSFVNKDGFTHIYLR